MCNTTQVLTLTHELATVEELEPYLSWRLRPARPNAHVRQVVQDEPAVLEGAVRDLLLEGPRPSL